MVVAEVDEVVEAVEAGVVSPAPRGIVKSVLLAVEDVVVVDDTLCTSPTTSAASTGVDDGLGEVTIVVDEGVLRVVLVNEEVIEVVVAGCVVEPVTTGVTTPRAPLTTVVLTNIVELGVTKLSATH